MSCFFRSRWLLRGINCLLAACCIMLPQRMGAQTPFFGCAYKTIATVGRYPAGIAVDGKGTVYVAEPDANRVIKKTLIGGVYVESTVASKLNWPQRVAVDTNGNVYISDSNNRVLKETPSGNSYKQSTVADQPNNGLNNPLGVAVDGSGNVYIVDSGNGRVLQETPSGDGYVQTTVVAAGTISPNAVAVDKNGNIYLDDYATHQVFKETPTGGSYTQSIVLDSGNYQPIDVGVDGAGIVYILDWDNYVLKKIPAGDSYADDGVITDLADGPKNMAVNEHGDIYLSDPDNVRIIEITTTDFGKIAVGKQSGIMTLVFDAGGGYSFGKSQAVLTEGAAGHDFADNGTGSLIINGPNHPYPAYGTATVDVTFKPRRAGTCKGAVVLKDTSGNILATAYIQGTGATPQVAFLPGTQSAMGQAFVNPTSVAVDGNGHTYVADGSCVYTMYPPGSGESASIVVDDSVISAQFTSLALDGSGSLYIVDSHNLCVWKVTLKPSSGYTRSIVLDSGLADLSAVAVDGHGNVYLADQGNHVVLKESPSWAGYVQTVVVAGGGTFWPSGLAIDGSGCVYITDAQNGSLLKETPSGAGYSQTTILHNNSVYSQGVTVDGVGNIYLADLVNDRILKETPTESGYTQSTILEDGLSNCRGLTVDRAGNCYIADTGHHRVIKLDVAALPRLTFDSTAVGLSSDDSPRTVTITNIGNANLQLPAPISGHNPSLTTGFTLDLASTFPRATSGGSSAVLPAGASGTLLIGFLPKKTGLTSGSLALTDNNLNAAAPIYATQTIILKGISPADAPIVLGHLSQTYSGLPLPATASTTPAGLSVIFTYNGDPTAPTAVGTYTAVGTINNPYYQGTTSGILTINKATLTVKADAVRKAYGESNPLLTYSIAGFKGSDTADTAMTGSPDLATTAIDSSMVGTYPITITPGTLDAANYKFACANGTLTVTKALPVITWDSPDNIIYGNRLSATQLNATVSTPVLGKFTYSPASGTLLGGGTHTLSVTFTPTDTAHYTTSTKTVAITVDKAPTMVTLGSLNQAYTGAARVATATTVPSGLPVMFTYDGNTTAPKAAGSYAVVGTINSPNYQSSATGTLVVNKAKATLVLGHLTQTYTGSPLSATATTTPAGLHVDFTYNGDSTAPTAAGNYPVVGTINSSNYQGTASGILTISKATLTVKANAVSKVHGASNPPLTYTMTGFKGTDTKDVATTGEPVLATTATDTSPVGTYPISVKVGNLAAANYKFACVNGSLTVTAK
jgi:streptogramin lyase